MSETAEKIQFESRRVGTIEVDAKDVMHFDALPGFAGKRRFVVVEHDASSPLAWLVSLDDADLAFVVANPWTFFPDYDPPVDREHLATLGIEKKADVELLCIVTLAGKTVNLNLAAPLLINSSTRVGLQVISDDARYATRTPIPDLEESKPAQPSDVKESLAKVDQNRPVATT